MVEGLDEFRVIEGVEFCGLVDGLLDDVEVVGANLAFWDFVL